MCSHQESLDEPRRGAFTDSKFVLNHDSLFAHTDAAGPSGTRVSFPPPPAVPAVGGLTPEMAKVLADARAAAGDRVGRLASAITIEAQRLAVACTIMRSRSMQQYGADTAAHAYMAQAADAARRVCDIATSAATTWPDGARGGIEPFDGMRSLDPATADYDEAFMHVQRMAAHVAEHAATLDALVRVNRFFADEVLEFSRQYADIPAFRAAADSLRAEMARLAVQTAVMAGVTKRHRLDEQERAAEWKTTRDICTRRCTQLCGMW